ncbi:hypothetical protein AB0F81_21985 [Actinoplanes sp. NPDC024001]|uniref:hypothetical protein n=1 Tax=Actinoplanes sp. NPDC024001 TaxID=3154598 RepID=UPI0033E8B6FC
MTTERDKRAVRPPWHMWVVAVATFAIYFGGARDFLRILANDADYMVRQFGEPGVNYFADYPPVLRLIWAINIVGGLVAPCLLLALSRWALAAAAVAAAAQVVLLIVTFGFRDRWDALGAATSWFDIGIGVATVALVGYCWVMRRRGTLR